MRGAEHTTSCCRYTTLIFNVIFLLLGLSVVIMAGIVVGDEVGKLSGHGVSTGLLLIGSLIILVSSLGTQASCAGDLQKWSLYYAVMLLFVLIATCVLCSLVFQEATVKENLSSGWNIADLETRRNVQTNLKW